MPARRLAHVLLLSLALALSAWRCSGASRSPVAPTVPATGAALAGANVVNWACFAGSGAGAFGSELCGARGPSVVGTQRIGASILDAPTGLTQSFSGTTVTLTWQTAPGGDPPTSYVIEAGSSSGRTDLANFDSNSLQTTLTVTSVPAGVYYVRVRARNSSGVGPVSNEVVVNVGGGSCLAAPAAPTALNAAVSGSSVTLDWAAPAGGCPVLTYRIEAGSAPGGSNLAIVVTGTTATTFSASNVGPGTYYVSV